jgi:hypothetical protein
MQSALSFPLTEMIDFGKTMSIRMRVKRDEFLREGYP